MHLHPLLGQRDSASCLTCEAAIEPWIRVSEHFGSAQAAHTEADVDSRIVLRIWARSASSPTRYELSAHSRCVWVET